MGQLELFIASGGVLVTVLGWTGAALYSRLTGLLDDTASRLADVADTLARIEAGHGARIEALERGGL